RITPQKRLDVFLRAMRIVMDSNRDVIGAVFGEPGIQDYEYYSEIRHLHRQMGLGDEVRFMGFHERMRDVYAAADAVVLSTELEPFLAGP
ncbi:MAG: glycosyltransferase, partial [Bryobacteraceae bacterium]